MAEPTGASMIDTVTGDPRASARTPRREPYTKPITPDTYEKVLAVGAVLLLVAVVVAIARGGPTGRSFPRWSGCTSPRSASRWR